MEFEANPLMDDFSTVNESRLYDRMLGLTQIRAPKSRKNKVRNVLRRLEKSIDSELAEARFNAVVVVLSGVVTGVMAAGASIFSNTWGVVSTLVAGGSGTVGIATAAKDSLLSYSSLKTKRRVEINRLKGKFDGCGEEEEECLNKVEKGIDEVYESILKEVSSNPAK